MRGLAHLAVVRRAAITATSSLGALTLVVASYACSDHIAHAQGYVITNYDSDILLARQNLDRYYAAGVGRIYTAPGVSWINERGDTVTACGDFDAEEGMDAEAFYCGNSKVLYIDYTFLRYQHERFGYDGIMVVLAHEFGHHVQRLWRENNSYIITPPSRTLASELQADCLAGGAMAWMSTAFRGLTRSFLGQVPASAGDVPGSVPSHGSSSDRQFWFLWGWDQRNSVIACQRQLGTPR